MKKLTLNQTWTLCLKMWKWIAAEKRKHPRKQTWKSKFKWLRAHGYGTEDLEANCFFCEYTDTHGDNGCAGCPGRKIDKEFHCENESYHWHDESLMFNKKLVSLNRKRMKGKK